MENGGNAILIEEVEREMKDGRKIRRNCSIISETIEIVAIPKLIILYFRFFFLSLSLSHNFSFLLISS